MVVSADMADGSLPDLQRCSATGIPNSTETRAPSTRDWITKRNNSRPATVQYTGSLESLVDPDATLRGLPILRRVRVVIDHLGLPATDAEQAAQWFSEILGL